MSKRKKTQSDNRPKRLTPQQWARYLKWLDHENQRIMEAEKYERWMDGVDIKLVMQNPTGRLPGYDRW